MSQNEFIYMDESHKPNSEWKYKPEKNWVILTVMPTPEKLYADNFRHIYITRNKNTQKSTGVINYKMQ